MPLTRLDRDASVANVRHYGATGNGTADDTAAIARACTFITAAGGGTLYFPTGLYKVAATSSPVSFTGVSDVRITGERGAILWCPNIRAGQIISVTGSRTLNRTTVAAGSNIAKGALSVTVAAGGGALLAANQWIAIRSGASGGSGEVFNPDRPTTDYKCEFAQVKSIAGDTVTLHGPTLDSYDATTYSVAIDTYAFASGIVIDGLELRGKSADVLTGTATGGSSTTVTDSGRTWTTNQYAGYYVRVTSGTGVGSYAPIVSNTATALTVSAWTGGSGPGAGSGYAIYAHVTGVYIARAQDVRVSGLTIDGCRTTGVQVNQSVGVVISAVTATGHNEPQLGYGCNVSGHDIRVVDCTFRDGRHAVDTSGHGAEVSGADPVARFILFDGNTAHRMIAAPFSTHGASEYVTITNNAGFQCSGAITTRGRNVTIARNVVYGAIRDDAITGDIITLVIVGENGYAGISGTGLRLVENTFHGGGNAKHGLFSYSPLIDAEIVGNQFAGFTQHGIAPQGLTLRGCQIADNLVDCSSHASSSFHGIVFQPHTAADGNNQKRLRVTGNTIRNSLGQIMRFEGMNAATDPSDDIVITDNIFDQCASSIFFQSGTYSGITIARNTAHNKATVADLFASTSTLNRYPIIQDNRLAAGVVPRGVVGWGATAPSGGAFIVGDLWMHSAPISGGNVGWICVTAGNPGTWKTWGTIA